MLKTKVNKTNTTVSVYIVDEDHPVMSVAVADMDRMSNHWWLARLFVNINYRNKGLGRTLINALRENAGEIPIEVMPGGYDIPKKNQFAFYKKCGFIRVDKHTMMLNTK